MTQPNAPDQRWVKIDLHIHTPASEDYAERDVTFLQILREAEQRGLEIIALTDHNTIAGYEQMRREVEFLQQLERTRRATIADHQQLDEYLRVLRVITVLPGFEFTSHYGSHILAIFPPTTMVTILEATLLRLGVPPERLKDGATGLPDTAHVTEAYDIIAKSGGLVIAAHANGAGGVITETLRMGTSGQSRVAATQHRSLSALEFVNFYTDHGTFTSPGFYTGKTEHYERRMFCIQGSDAHRVRRASNGSDVAHRHGVGDRYFEALLPEPSFAALQGLLNSYEFERVRVPKRDQKQWDIDQLRFGVASERNILRGSATEQSLLLQDVAALCNMGGGTLIIGAGNDGNGQVEGVARPSDVSEQLRLAAQQLIDPAPVLSMELVRYESRDVIRVEVRAAKTPPYITQGQVWLRRDAQTAPANRGEILQLARRALAESGSSPLDNGQEWDVPRSGVEIVDEQRINSEWQYEIRDLRTMPNVVRERSQGLWAYAIDRHTDLREGRADLEAQITWAGQLGLWRMYRQGSQVKYDLVHRDANGIIDHVFYGVTDWGLSPTWNVLLDSVRASDGATDKAEPESAHPTPKVTSPTAVDGSQPRPLPPPSELVVPVAATAVQPPANSEPYIAPPNFGGRQARWQGRGAILRIVGQGDGGPLFDLAMRDSDGVNIQQYLRTARDKLNEKWLALIMTERPRTGIEVMSYVAGEDGIIRIGFRDLRTGEVSAPWRIEELKEGSVREYAARMHVLDRQLNEETVRWWGNLGYFRPMRSQVDLVYRDADGVDHFFYACRREELRGPWKNLLEVWNDAGIAPPVVPSPPFGIENARSFEPPLWMREQLVGPQAANNTPMNGNEQHD
ncbi:MAG: putative DNA binding domain-containing protein [Herpetosiphonaceae bacterium]|nr:putative DNA binding domain-containing protein [Herpetosiphonaceae bacterium]